jgi:hypothetical protein
MILIFDKNSSNRSNFVYNLTIPAETHNPLPSAIEQDNFSAKQTLRTVVRTKRARVVLSPKHFPCNTFDHAD